MPLGRAGQAGMTRMRGSPNARTARGLAGIAGDADMSDQGIFGRVRAGLVGPPPRTQTLPTAHAVLQGLRNQVDEVGDQVYGPFASMGPNRKLKQMVTALANQPGMRAAIQNPGLRYNFSGPPDLGDLRQIRSALAAAAEKEARGGNPGGTFNQVHTAFKTEMENSFPGLWEADRAYAMVNEVREGFEMGFRNSRRAGESAAEGISGWQRPAEVREMLRTFAENPRAQDAMRQGMRHRLLEDLLQTKDDVVPQIRMFMNADEGGREMMRELFPQGSVGDDQFTLFSRLVREHGKPELILQQLRSSAKWGAIAATLGAAVAGGGAASSFVQSLFN